MVDKDKEKEFRGKTKPTQEDIQRDETRKLEYDSFKYVWNYFIEHHDNPREEILDFIQRRVDI